MANDAVLGMLGLSLRAGRLAVGSEQVRVLCENKKARCVFIASGSGESVRKKAELYAGKANIPCVTLLQDKEELGSALGRSGCAVCAVSDIGLAASVLKKLAALDTAYAGYAEELGRKNERIQTRKKKAGS